MILVKTSPAEQMDTITTAKDQVEAVFTLAGTVARVVQVVYQAGQWTYQFTADVVPLVPLCTGGWAGGSYVASFGGTFAPIAGSVIGFGTVGVCVWKLYWLRDLTPVVPPAVAAESVVGQLVNHTLALERSTNITAVLRPAAEYMSKQQEAMKLVANLGKEAREIIVEKADNLLARLQETLPAYTAAPLIDNSTDGTDFVPPPAPLGYTNMQAFKNMVEGIRAAAADPTIVNSWWVWMTDPSRRIFFIVPAGVLSIGLGLYILKRWMPRLSCRSPLKDDKPLSAEDLQALNEMSAGEVKRPSVKNKASPFDVQSSISPSKRMPDKRWFGSLRSPLKTEENYLALLLTDPQDYPYFHPCSPVFVDPLSETKDKDLQAMQTKIASEWNKMPKSEREFYRSLAQLKHRSLLGSTKLAFVFQEAEKRQPEKGTLLEYLHIHHAVFAHLLKDGAIATSLILFPLHLREVVKRTLNEDPSFETAILNRFTAIRDKKPIEPCVSILPEMWSSPMIDFYYVYLTLRQKVTEPPNISQRLAEGKPLTDKELYWLEQNSQVVKEYLVATRLKHGTEDQELELQVNRTMMGIILPKRMHPQLREVIVFKDISQRAFYFHTAMNFRLFAAQVENDIVIESSMWTDGPYFKHSWLQDKREYRRDAKGRPVKGPPANKPRDLLGTKTCHQIEWFAPLKDSSTTEEAADKFMSTKFPEFDVASKVRLAKEPKSLVERIEVEMPAKATVVIGPTRLMKQAYITMLTMGQFTSAWCRGLSRFVFWQELNSEVTIAIAPREAQSVDSTDWKDESDEDMSRRLMGLIHVMEEAHKYGFVLNPTPNVFRYSPETDQVYLELHQSCKQGTPVPLSVCRESRGLVKEFMTFEDDFRALLWSWFFVTTGRGRRAWNQTGVFASNDMKRVEQDNGDHVSMMLLATDLSYEQLTHEWSYRFCHSDEWEPLVAKLRKQFGVYNVPIRMVKQPGVYSVMDRYEVDLRRNQRLIKDTDESAVMTISKFVILKVENKLEEE